MTAQAMRHSALGRHMAMLAKAGGALAKAATVADVRAAREMAEAVLAWARASRRTTLAETASGVCRRAALRAGTLLRAASESRDEDLVAARVRKTHYSPTDPYTDYQARPWERRASTERRVAAALDGLRPPEDDWLPARTVKRRGGVPDVRFRLTEAARLARRDALRECRAAEWRLVADGDQ